MPAPTAVTVKPFYATLNRVDDLITRGWKSAPDSLVKLLHDKATGPHVLRHLTEGMRHQWPGQSVASASLMSFANRCMVHGRADIVRAVIETGTPAWLGDGQDKRRARARLRNDTPAAWLYAMSCYRSGAGPTCVVHVASFATQPLNPHSRAFFQLAIEFDPKNERLNDVSSMEPEAAALVTELMMTHRIASAAAASQDPRPAVSPVATPLRRSRMV